MLHNEAIEIENKLFLAMLEESAKNNNIKTILSQVAHVLSKNVLARLEAEVKQEKITQFSDLSQSTQEALITITAMHTAEHRQYGAMMPEVHSSKNIISSKENILAFLDSQKNVLSDIPLAKSADQMAIVLKILIDLGCVYYEAPDAWHTPRFKEINSVISPATEEIDIRLYRTELKEEPKLALTFGISTEESDLGLEKIGEGRKAGKAIFGKVSMKTRLEVLWTEYDKMNSEKHAEKMTYYGIPLKKNERKPLEYYTVKWETCFEKLVKNANGKMPLPLIASVSGSTARLLGALQDLGAFYEKDEIFNFDKAQIFANCIMAFVGNGGHHSFVEIAEVYDRLLDDTAIHHLEEHKMPIVPANVNEKVEEKMPYYRYGNYASFFNKSYVEKIIEAVPQLKKNYSCVN